MVDSFSFGSGDDTGRFTGYFNDTAIPWFPPNPNDLSDIEIGNAALEDGCPCNYTTPTFTGLSAATSRQTDITMLFHGRPLEQISPVDTRANNNGLCKTFPINGLDKTIYFHVYNNPIVNYHNTTLKDNPSGDHRRINIRDIPTTPALLSSRVENLGYQHVIGDSPGYGRGRQISFEGGKISLGLEKPDIIKTKTFTPQLIENNSNNYYKVEFGLGNVYYRKFIIKYSDVPAGVNNIFHIAFKYNVALDGCGPDQNRYSQILKHETMIDNHGAVAIGAKPAANSESNSPSNILNANNTEGQFTVVDCRFSTADYIEIWNFQGKITSIEVNYLESKDYFNNVVRANSFCSAFDRQNRIFVFYEDEINFTELPYTKIVCEPPSSSSSAPSSSSSVIPPTGGSGGGGGSGSGGGGGIDGGGGGGGGIPGIPPVRIQYDLPSSSSSSTTTEPSSSSSSEPSSSSSTDTTPPAPPISTRAEVILDQDGGADVVIRWEDGDSIAGSTATDKVVKYNIYRSNDPDSNFTKIGESANTNFTDPNPVENTWNYYRITAVDAAGNESGYVLVEIFVVKPKNCVRRDCAGCGQSGYKSRNGFTVFFSDFRAEQLSFECEGCTSNEKGFIRILQESFYEERDTAGNKVPKRFCLLPACDDENISQKCKWTNTFYVTALIHNSIAHGCRPGYEKVLIPLTINLYQDADTGWMLEAYCIAPDCFKMPLFESPPTLSACRQPVRFINKLSHNPGSVSGDQIAKYSTEFCAIYPPEDYKNDTGTISCAMSPDYGQTWYEYKGIINIKQDKKAVNPFVTYDEHKDTFHLFWVERDFSDSDSRGQAATQGFNAALCRISFFASFFLVEDAFKEYLPTSSSNDLIPTSSSSSTDLFIQEQLTRFSEFGQDIRTTPVQYIIREEHFGREGTEGARRISLTEEHNSAYIDNEGQIRIVRAGAAGTLVDPPDRLTRRRRRKSQCGSYTWTVSGITDDDCGCQSVLGTFNLEFNPKTANFEDPKWTLTASSDYKYWDIFHDDGTDNSMLRFKKKRGINLCPPEGIYELYCSRCTGGIVGTLEAHIIGIYGDNTFIQNDGYLEASTVNKTDFGQVPIGFAKEQEFVIKNIRSKPLTLTGNPRVSIIGANASEFTVVTNPIEIIPPNDSTTFVIRFEPNADNCVDINNPANKRKAQVRIQIDEPEQTPYHFNIAGNCIPQQDVTPEEAESKLITNNFAPGVIFSADAVGKILISADGGYTWQENTEGIKTGEKHTEIWDREQKALYSFYITDDMLFMRRYPAWQYSLETDQTRDIEPAFDGINIVEAPQTLVPNSDVLQFGIPTSVHEWLALPNFFGLPNINLPEDIIDQFEEDLRSKKTPIINEKDPRGLPLFLAGNKQGTLIKAQFPYIDDFIFNEYTAVGFAKPAATITKSGLIRFFYIDSYGNINGGTLSGPNPRLDTKLRNK